MTITPIMTLADYVVVAEGKLYLSGACIDRIPAGCPFGLAIWCSVPWTDSNHQYNTVLRLVDADGAPLNQPDGTPFEVARPLEVGRPPGYPAGAPLAVVLHAINFGPGMPLAPNSRYEFTLEIDGEHQPGWSVGFNTGPLMFGQQAA